MFFLLSVVVLFLFFDVSAHCFFVSVEFKDAIKTIHDSKLQKFKRNRSKIRMANAQDSEFIPQLHAGRHKTRTGPAVAISISLHPERVLKNKRYKVALEEGHTTTDNSSVSEFSGGLRRQQENPLDGRRHQYISRKDDVQSGEESSEENMEDVFGLVLNYQTNSASVPVRPQSPDLFHRRGDDDDF